MAAAEVATAAEADVATAQAAVGAIDTGPASEELAGQQEAADIKGAQAAFKVLAAIQTVGAEGNPNASPPTTTTTTRKATSTLSVSYGATGLKFSAKGPGNATADPVWAAAETNMAPAIDGWSSGTLTAKGTATGTPGTGETGTGLVYSDIDAPKHKLFAVVHGANPTLTVAEGTTQDADTAANWKLAKISPANTYGGGTVAGTYAGVEGTFTCAGTGCPSRLPVRRSDGTIIAATGETGINPADSTWKFKPTDEAAMVAVQDDSYLFFGYWLSKSKIGPEDFQVWYGGWGTKSPVVATQALLTALDEKVTYTGAAAGKYVTKDVVANTAEAGYFTASAELTADFTDLAPDSGKLSGTISGFKAGDSAPLGDLKLSLAGNLIYNDGDSTLTLNTAEDPATNVVTAESGGQKHGTVGGWEAQLFGTEKNTNIPTGVVGAFDAQIDNHAVVVGGFGATK